MRDTASSYRWIALGLVVLAQSSSSFVLSAPSPLAPLFQAEWELTKTQVGMLASATAAGAWSVVLIAGLLTDRFGIRRVLSIGLMLTGALLLSMGLVTSLYQAIVLMFVAGVTRGLVFPGTTKAVLTWFPLRARATAMGIKQMGMPISGILAALVLPGLGLAFGWRAAIAGPGLLIVTAGVIVGLLFREAPMPPILPSQKIGPVRAMSELIRNQRLLVLCSIGFLFLVVQLAMLAYLALYLAEVVLAEMISDPAARIVAAGSFLAVCQLGGAVGRAGWGVVSDRLFKGRRMVVLAVIGFTSAALTFAISTFGHGLPISLLGVFCFIYGATVFGWNGVYNVVLGESVDPRYLATGIGVAMTLTEVGTIAGPPLFGLVVDLSHSYQVAWIALAGVAAVGAAVCALQSRGEARYRDRTSSSGVVQSPVS